MATPLRALTPTHAYHLVATTLSHSHLNSRRHNGHPTPQIHCQTLLKDRESGFEFTQHNPGPLKPRERGVTSIRGPCYTIPVRRPRDHGSPPRRPEIRWRLLQPTRRIPPNATPAHRPRARERRRREHRGLGSNIPWPLAVGMWGAGGDTEAAELEGIGTSDPGKVGHMARRFAEDVGGERVVIERGGITENVKAWRTDVIQSVLKELLLKKVMFEAAESSSTSENLALTSIFPSTIRRSSNSRD
ncbi:hypothetical protein F5B19DRAFT_493314 [Rostrohypoxylon terebratum]|nr:hypothetical protein F5B19DRAFT_493314 [Rostrohypoxylon terebratum]